MFGVFSKLFGSKEIINSGINAIDALVYTDEEKSEQKLKMLKAYEPFKIAQRYIAIIFCVPYALGWASIFIASYFGIDTGIQKELLHGEMSQIVSIIVAFYFIGGAVSGARK